MDLCFFFSLSLFHVNQWMHIWVEHIGVSLNKLKKIKMWQDTHSCAQNEEWWFNTVGFKFSGHRISIQIISFEEVKYVTISTAPFAGGARWQFRHPSESPAAVRVLNSVWVLRGSKKGPMVTKLLWEASGSPVLRKNLVTFKTIFLFTTSFWGLTRGTKFKRLHFLANRCGFPKGEGNVKTERDERRWIWERF